jgi:hypothetical protein
MGSGDVRDMRTKFHKDWFRHSKVNGGGGYTLTQTATWSHKPTLFFQNKESRLKPAHLILYIVSGYVRVKMDIRTRKLSSAIPLNAGTVLWNKPQPLPPRPFTIQIKPLSHMTSHNYSLLQRR